MAAPGENAAMLFRLQTASKMTLYRWGLLVKSSAVKSITELARLPVNTQLPGHPRQQRDEWLSVKQSAKHDRHRDRGPDPHRR